jgi:hypothetical protein
MEMKLVIKKVENSNGEIFGDSAEEFLINLEKNPKVEKDCGDKYLNCI